jgi:hypothetical protein
MFGLPIVSVSDDQGITWTDIATISTNGMIHYQSPFTGVPYGHIRKAGTNLVCGFYNYAVDDPIYAWVGSLDGLTWTNHLIDYEANLSEPEILPINDTFWLSVSRRENWAVGNPCCLWADWTTNAGVTWYEPATGMITTWTNGSFSSPVSLNLITLPNGPAIEMDFGDRYSGILYNSVALVSQAWTNTSLLSMTNIQNIGQINDSAPQSDGGYPSGALLDNSGKELVSFYRYHTAGTANIKSVVVTPNLPFVGIFAGNGSGLNNVIGTVGTSFGSVDIPTNITLTHGYSGYMTNGVFVSTGTY